MGEMINVRCKVCKKEWRCFTGNGLLHGRKEGVLAAFSEDERKQAENLMGAATVPLYDFQYRLAVCGYCQNIVAIPVLRVVDSDEILEGKCPLCGKKTKNFCGEEQSTEKWSKKIACPICKSRSLEMEEIGHWD